MDLPYYIIPNSTDAKEWYNERGILKEREHSTLIDEFDTSEDESSDEEYIEESVEQYGRHRAHFAAIEEDLGTLQELAESESDEVFSYVDDNGWTPLHEAARTLNLEIVRFIVEHGADVNARTLENDTALDIAVSYGGDDNPVVVYLKGFQVDNEDWNREL